MLYLGMLLTFVGMEKISPFQSTFAFAQEVRSKFQEGDAVMMFSSPDHFSDFPFYLKRRVIIVGSDQGTLVTQYKQEKYAHEADEWFQTADDLVALFNARKRRVFCLMDEEEFRELESRKIRNVTILKKGFGKLLIANF
jgi:hypothetical protein